MQILKLIFRIILIFIGLFSIFTCIKVIPYILFNINNLMPAIFGLFFILWGLFFEYILKFTEKGFLKYFRNFAFLSIFIFMIGFVFFFLKLNSLKILKPENNADAIIILGAGLKGTTPSSALSARLFIGKKYLEENPNTIVVVSGGQGKDEIISEAAAMKKYLLDNGIDENRILIEDKSTSTIENFKFSKIILDGYFQKEDYKLLFVTNDFHVVRSKLIAKSIGLEPGSLSFKSQKNMELIYYSREYLALIWYYLRSFKI